MRVLRQLQYLPIHPFLISAFPVLALLQANLGQVRIADGLRPLTLSLVLATLAMGIHFLIFRDVRKAAIITAVSILLFFSYGHIYGEIKGYSVLGVTIGRHRYLSISIALMYLFAAFAIRRLQIADEITLSLNVVAFLLVVAPLAAILLRTSDQQSREPSELDSQGDSSQVTGQAEKELPDIYYIVPDSYLGADVLEEQYDFDNREFLDFLADQGFFVAGDSRANYMWTHQSLSSSLNLDYLHNVIGGEKPGRQIDPQIHVQQSLIRRLLESRGYTTVGFITGWEGSEWLDADVVLTPQMTRLEGLKRTGMLREFEAMLIYLTPARILLDLDKAGSVPLTRYLRASLDERYQLQREIILSLFENMKRVPDIEGPKFVFVHVLSPHSPYLFDKDGTVLPQEGPFTLSQDESLDPDLEKTLYLNQLIFINSKLRDAIAHILSSSDRPVRIIIQADHGFGVELKWDEVKWSELEARMSILNAYYLSEDCRRELYPSITPVNSFRLVLACELGMDQELLEDTVYIGYDSFVPLDEFLELQNIQR